jgi:putative transposase
MPRVARSSAGGVIYHVLNRGNGRAKLFHKDGDYEAFLKILQQVREAVPEVGVLAWCLMPNHWHLILHPQADGVLSRFMLRLSTTHVRRHFAHYHTTSGGHLYQGRFKSFPIEEDYHLLVACRYVEANALRAKLVDRAERWRWSSLWATERGGRHDPRPDAWPISRPRNWVEKVNAVVSKPEVEQLQESFKRGAPFGSEAWTRKTADLLNLQFTLRPRGRPRKVADARK